MTPHAPSKVELIGNEVAVIWNDGCEDYIPMEILRACSPSAENMGESDIFGRVIGGDPRKSFPGVTTTDFEFIGRYAIRFTFSDGHGSGLYSYDYLHDICKALRQGNDPSPNKN